MSIRVEETVEVEVAILRRCSDGVIEIEIKPGSRIDGPHITEVLMVQQGMTPGMASVLVDARRVVSMSRQAMEITANNPVNDITAATALLVDNAVSRLIGNFFIRFAMPPYPARLFQDPQDARHWVLRHLAEKR